MRVLVYGPESSCTRYAARLCASILAVPGWQEWGGTGELGAVVHAPMPYRRDGEWRDWPEWQPTHLVLTVRDRERTLESAMRRHPNRRDYLGNLERAATAQRGAMRNHKKVFVFSVEALGQLRDEYVTMLADFLGGSVPNDWERPHG